MSRLHVFDMDGTLLRGAASVELSRHLGVYAAARAVEDGWLRGEVGDVEFWERMLPLWAGVTDAQVDAAFEAAPWIDGVRDVLADIAARGEHSVVISQSPLFFVRRLRRWGAGAAYGTVVEPGGHCVEDALLTAQHKVDITAGVLDRLGLTPRECVAYGDSTSDVPLFEWLPHTVAVNAGPAVRRLASSAYDGDDLRGAYRAGRSLVEPGLEPGPVPA
ncbi:haloacid dehalogenase [Pseudonocardia sp. CNS-139]|nr:haloacid dehalogenase [Pseudonocardia sp. CNS-139]